MKIVLIFLVVGLTVICCVSDKEIQARERIRKSIKLEIGMTNGDVKKLIGEPDTVIFYDLMPLLVFFTNKQDARI